MIKRLRIWLFTAFGILAIIAQQVLARYRRKHHDAEAGVAEDEARKVAEAGKAGDADAVLESFRKATDRWQK